MQSTTHKEELMNVSLPLTASPSRADAAVSSVEIPQYRLRAIVAIWAAAALPMAALAWLVAPVLADRFARRRHRADGEGALSCPSPSASSGSSSSSRSSSGASRGRFAGRRSARRSGSVPRGARAAAASAAGVWLILIPLIVLFGAAHELIPAIAAPENRDFATLVESRRRQGVPERRLGLVRPHPRHASSSTPCSARSSCFAGSSFRA